MWLDFAPTKGHEQSGRRPALVLSPREYNEKVGMAIVCPVTSNKKGYPFEVSLTGKVRGVVLADQVRSIDWRARNAEVIQVASNDVMRRVSDLLSLLLP